MTKHQPAGAPLCDVHGEPLRDDAIPVFEAWCMEPPPGSGEVARTRYPNANTFVWGTGLPDPYPVKYCPACRAAEAAWSGVGDDELTAEQLMRLGCDPERGSIARTPAATLVDDYVWIEKYVRTVVALGYAPYVLPIGPGRTADEYILEQVRAARAEKAPPDAVYRTKDGWRTLDRIPQAELRRALALGGD